jgi:hypothetical protein
MADTGTVQQKLVQTFDLSCTQNWLSLRALTRLP